MEMRQDKAFLAEGKRDAAEELVKDETFLG